MLQFPIAISSSLPLTFISLLPTPPLHFSPIIRSCHVLLSHKPTSMPAFPFQNSSPSCLPSPSSFPFHPWMPQDTAAIFCLASVFSVPLSELHPSTTSAFLLRGSPDLPMMSYPFLDNHSNVAISSIYKPKFASLYLHLLSPLVPQIFPFSLFLPSHCKQN